MISQGQHDSGAQAPQELDGPRTESLLREGLKQHQAGNVDAAERAYRQVLERDPKNAPATHFLGMLAHHAGRREEALALIGESIARSPKTASFHSNLGTVYGQLGLAEEAVGSFRCALRLNPNLFDAHKNLGLALESLNRFHEAAVEYRAALLISPDAADVLAHLARAMGRSGELPDPTDLPGAEGGDASAHALRTLGSIYERQGRLEEAISARRRLLAIRPELAAAHSALLYTLHYSPDFDAEAIYRESREWGRRFCDPLQGSIPPHENVRTPDRALRVGYVSPDLREHTVTKFVSAVIQHHDKELFQVTCYSDAERPDRVTDRLKGWAERWRDTRGLDNATLEQIIRQDRIDILVDLRGHAADNRLLLFARKPAPVQINMVGYFNTTGLSAIDYRLSDRYMDPPGKTEHLNTEKLVRIEPSRWCYSPEPDAPSVVEPPVIKNSYVTFGSLNKAVKVSEPCARLWSTVLGAVPNSRLLLSDDGDATGAVADRLVGLGILPERIILVDKTRTSRAYMERFNHIDIVLDTLPFGGITTTCDGLWMGVPAVSLYGETVVGRACTSILHAANLAEFATDTPERFVRVAAELAMDVERLRAIRLGMRERLRISPLLDHVHFAKRLEAEYRSMWRNWCSAS